MLMESTEKTFSSNFLRLTLSFPYSDPSTPGLCAPCPPHSHATVDERGGSGRGTVRLRRLLLLVMRMMGAYDCRGLHGSTAGAAVEAGPRPMRRTQRAAERVMLAYTVRLILIYLLTTDVTDRKSVRANAAARSAQTSSSSSSSSLEVGSSVALVCVRSAARAAAYNDTK